MPEFEIRAKIRALMASGVLPSEPPVIQRNGRDSADARRQDSCAVCAGPDPTVSYFWTGGVVVRPHAACDARWKLEQGRCG
jgi:hypothetical protein